MCFNYNLAVSYSTSSNSSWCHSSIELSMQELIDGLFLDACESIQLKQFVFKFRSSQSPNPLDLAAIFGPNRVNPARRGRD